MTSIESRGSVVPKPVGPPPNHLKPLRKGNRHKEAVKQEILQSQRDELPYLTPVETYEYRNTYFESLCTRILADGFHRTFTEMLELIKLQRRQREEAGPDSMLSQVEPLEVQPEKLKSMSRFLMVSEISERKGDFLAAYEAYLQLAQYFEEDEQDKWLVEHYYHRCLRTGPRIQGDEGRKQAEAHFNIGVAMQNSFKLESAMQHFTEFYKLSDGKEDWLHKDGKTLHGIACERLVKVFISRSEQLTDPTDSKEMLTRAHDIAKESGDFFLQARCACHLGAAFDRLDKPDTALHFYKEFYQLATQLDDAEQHGLACEALANVYERQNKVDENMHYLKEFAEVTEGKNDQLFSRACRGLGAALNRQSEFQKATDYFSKAFSVARTLQDKEDIYLTRMQFGISQAFAFSDKYDDQIRQSTPNSLRNLLTWKNERKSDELKKELADKPSSSIDSRKPMKRELPPHIRAAEAKAKADAAAAADAATAAAEELKAADAAAAELADAKSRATSAKTEATDQ